MASEKEILDPFDQTKFEAISIEIRMRAGAILLNVRNGKTSNWIIKDPPEWVMLILTLTRGCSRAILNYRELRKGFVEIAAVCLICVSFGDEVANDKLTDEERIMRFPGEHLPPHS